MKESHSEGVANHADLESCGACREGWAEAWTGERTGRAIEPRKFITSGRRRSGYVRKATPGAPKNARRSGVPRGRRPWHVGTRYAREPGDPGFARGAEARDASGSLRTEADDERTREVGQAHSTGEVPEPNRKTGGGGDGGKGPGQRGPATAKRGP